MREHIERLSYRFQFWQRERYGDHSPADPSAPRNPLGFVALVAVMSIILDATEPFFFHRSFDILSIVRIPTALAFLILYQSKSRWAWYIVTAWLPFSWFAFWLLRFAGYSRYQPRVHGVSQIVGQLLFILVIAAVIFWLFRVRDRYLRFIGDARLQET